MFVHGAKPSHVDERTREGKAGVTNVVGENLKCFGSFAEIAV